MGADQGTVRVAAGLSEVIPKVAHEFWGWPQDLTKHLKFDFGSLIRIRIAGTISYEDMRFQP